MNDKLTTSSVCGLGPSSSALPVTGTESSRVAAEDGTRGKSQEKLNAILARAREANKHRVRKNAVTIRRWELGSYAVTPASVDLDIERRRNAGAENFDEEVDRVIVVRLAPPPIPFPLVLHLYAASLSCMICL